MMVCYTADNINSNFGGVRERGIKNVFRKVQSDLDITYFRNWLFDPYCIQFNTNSMIGTPECRSLCFSILLRLK